MTLNSSSFSSTFCLLGLRHAPPPRPLYGVLGMEPRTLCIPGKHFASWATFTTFSSFELSISFCLKWVSCTQHRVESCFFIQYNNLCFDSVFKIPIFNVVIDMVRFKSIHLVRLIFSVCPSFLIHFSHWARAPWLSGWVLDPRKEPNTITLLNRCSIEPPLRFLYLYLWMTVSLTLIREASFCCRWSLILRPPPNWS